MPCEWLLIDGSSLILPCLLRRAGQRARLGDRRDAIGGFLDRLARLVADPRPRQLVIADDWAWRPQWRVRLISDYKAHRVSEPVPPGLVAHLPVITQLLEHIGIDVVGVADDEAEDVIATLTRLAPGTVEIASGDRDLFALVEDPRVRVLYPERSGLAVIDETEITRRYAIPGRRYGDFAILRGDPSDGLPGLKGVGAVTAAAMIRRHGDITGVLRDRPLGPADRKPGLPDERAEPHHAAEGRDRHRVSRAREPGRWSQGRRTPTARPDRPDRLAGFVDDDAAAAAQVPDPAVGTDRSVLDQKRLADRRPPA